MLLHNGKLTSNKLLHDENAYWPNFVHCSNAQEYKREQYANAYDPTSSHDDALTSINLEHEAKAYVRIVLHFGIFTVTKREQKENAPS
jgi:hypothetical protein